MKVFSIVLFTLTFTQLVWSSEDSPPSQEDNISKLKELLSSSTETLENEQDSSQVVSESEKNNTSVLPAESKPEIDPAESDGTTEEDTSKDRAKKSYSPANPPVESPYPLEPYPNHPYPTAHHVSHVHSYVGKPGPTYASSHISYSAPHPPPHYSPPYVHASPYCIEIRPKLPTQAPFLVCEPPYRGVVSSAASSSSVQQHPAGYIPPYGRSDEHQTQSPPEQNHQTTTTSPPPPATTPGQTTKPVTEKPKEKSGSHEQKSKSEKPKDESGSHEQKPAPSPEGSAARTVYGPASYYPPVHHGGIYAPYTVAHPLSPVKIPPPVPYYPPVHPPAYPPAHPPALPPAHPPAYPPAHPPAYPPAQSPAYPPAQPPAYPPAHPPAYPPVYTSYGIPVPYLYTPSPSPLVLNCHVQPSYAAAPQNPIAMLQLYMRPAPGHSYPSYREQGHEDEKQDKEKDKKEKISSKSADAPLSPAPTHPPNKARDPQGGMMMRQSSKEFAPWSMRAGMDQEPTSIGIPLPNGGSMAGEAEEEEDCGESSPKMAEAGKKKVPVGSKGQVSKETNKSPVNSRMNYYMPGPSMALGSFK